MKLGVPWSVKGIRPEARETARQAARRSGMSLGEWLNTTILEQAAEDGIRPPGYEDDDDDAYADELAGVHERLDDLTRRIAQFSRTADRGPRRVRHDRRDERDARDDQIAELIGRLDRRIEQFVTQSARPAPVAHVPPHYAPPTAPAAYAPPQYQQPYPVAYAPAPPRPAPSAPPPRPQPPQAGLDRAIAEIAARQRALRGEPPAPAPQPASAPAPEPMLQQVPAQNLTGLEDQLRRITDQIETLRRPGVEEAINALRDELGEIGRALNDAMPRRAIDTIERQIQGLTHRIAENRHAGADQHALSGIEQGLAEVRDALRGLTPAENLVGFNEAVAGLAHKIDLIVAQKDPETLNQLEHAITTLREMAAHVASNDAVGRLAAQVEKLGEKVEEFGKSGAAADALSNLEQRIDALARALAERAQNGSSVPPRLENLVQSLAGKIEQIQESRGDNLAAGHLEDRIVKLVERLDASDSRLSHLEAIERGLADLLVQIEDMRASKNAAALRAEAESAVGVDTLKHDLARTHDTLEAVNGTLGSLVDRLAKMEKEFRDSPRGAAPADDALELTQPVGRVAARAVPAPAAPPSSGRLPPAAPLQMPPAEAPAVKAEPAPPPKRMPAPKIGPIDPDLPPDQPLEPGSGPPRARSGARIAAPEPPPAKSSFIAAARRAAQAAVQQTAKTPKAETAADEAGEAEARAGVMKRVKRLFVAASIVAIVAGGAQLGAHYLLGHSADSKKTAQLGKTKGPAPAKSTTTAALTISPPLTQAIPPLAPANTLADSAPMLSPIPSPLSAPALGPRPAPEAAPAQAAASTTGEVTGSIPEPKPARAQTTASINPADRLPAEIGGPRLRTAAASGDGPAAYEIAVRYAEGRGVAVDTAEAARWYERAAAKGVALAQFRYASMLEKGVGVKKDLGQARRFYLAAAGKGNAKAMHNLAVLYAEGIEGKPDYATAVHWFRKAALHGVGDSQYNLGVLTARGLGTGKDLTEAYKWFALAAAQGDKEAARKRDEVATKLEAKALALAEQEVKGFTAAPQPQDAIAVATPPGGWNDAAGVRQAPAHGRAASFKVGKR
jgi:localization factor PodJL